MTEISYLKAGDYLIPNLTMPETSSHSLNKYGRMRKKYLKEHRPLLYNNMTLNGSLTAHLREIDETANRRIEQMMTELAKEAGVTEELKASDPLMWTGLMNNLKAQAEETVLTELVYS